MSDMGREISELEQKLAQLRAAQGSFAAASAPARRGPGRPPGRPAGRPGRPGRPAAPAASSAAAPAASQPAGKRRRRRSITAEQVASRQLQGRYLSLVRRFPANRRPGFAKIAKERGREAAIREMQDLLKK
jgi:hypothetical protein